MNCFRSRLENGIVKSDHDSIFCCTKHSVLISAGPGESSLTENERLAQQPVKLILESTCHHAYSSCKNDPECQSLLQPVLDHCNLSNCARNTCMSSLQHFYKMAKHKHSIEIAFCLCKKNEGKRDECMLAQSKMHPACAHRFPSGTEIPTCDALADTCRQDPMCRVRLERYEQNCAVDSLTKKCAGAPQSCRTAMLGILGTDLRSECDCRGAELTPLYQCLGWQRLLWVNPCVGEFLMDTTLAISHIRRIGCLIS
ncbi:hypothetical protein QAD02_006889 [Eretmocerus hayati]|uniref:Uncharacterized protein n=1 Tax=Eretmocerus hayati TaxID=131215 RepID=A0ACC2N2I0_9HYME|nr:hypothetical protein QAD02_006889 [Eretmocerus hayati]